MNKFTVFWLVWSGGMVLLSILVIWLKVKNNREIGAEKKQSEQKAKESEGKNE